MAPATNHKIPPAPEPHRPSAVTRTRVDEGGAQRQGEVPMVLRETERKRAFDVNRMQTELFTAFTANLHEGSMRIAEEARGRPRGLRRCDL